MRLQGEGLPHNSKPSVDLRRVAELGHSRCARTPEPVDRGSIALNQEDRAVLNDIACDTKKDNTHMCAPALGPLRTAVGRPLLTRET